MCYKYKIPLSPITYLLFSILGGHKNRLKKVAKCKLVVEEKYELKMCIFVQILFVQGKY